VKPGSRALGIAESTRESTSHLAGAVVRASRVLDGIAFARCTVGGNDATDAICTLIETIDRDDIQYVLVAGIAPAWFNIIDLHRLHDSTGLPVISVSFESSLGLDGAIRDAFDDPATVNDRLDTYHSQPDRSAITVNGESVYVRAVGTDNAGEIVRSFTPEGGRPEPLRVARMAARGRADDEG
jgi:endonuclease V-like protein UPF0215 family